MKSCYYCGRDVRPEEHALVEKVVLWAFSVGGEDLVDSFTHMTGMPPRTYDADGNPIICSVCAIREIAQSVPDQP